jgi:hypothetical protein
MITNAIAIVRIFNCMSNSRTIWLTFVTNEVKSWLANALVAFIG